MTYNVFIGAGVFPELAAAAEEELLPGNRLPKILSIIKTANPDIVGIQEAKDWDKGDPTVAEKVANELGMNYFLAATQSRLHLVLFTKFKIAEAENLSYKIGNIASHGGLHATLLTPDGQTIHVFVVHLAPHGSKWAERLRQIEILTQEMSPYMQSSTILIGDLNYGLFCESDVLCREYNALRKAGWQLVGKIGPGFDQIWTSRALSRSITGISFSDELLRGASDHLPVGAIIGIYPAEAKQ